jgi:hypothetical protein
MQRLHLSRQAVVTLKRRSALSRAARRVSLCSKQSVAKALIVVWQTVVRDVVFPREQVAITLEVLNQPGEREALFRGILHESSDREDLRRKMSFDESFHDQRVVEGILVVTLGEPT